MPWKKPSLVASLRARIEELESILAGKQDEIADLSKTLGASILVATLEKFNVKHARHNVMPIKPRPVAPGRSRLVKIRGYPLVTIEHYQEFKRDGMTTFWGSNQSRIPVRDDEIEISAWVDEAPAPIRPVPVPVVSELPPAPTEEDEFHPVENPKFEGVDYHDF